MPKLRPTTRASTRRDDLSAWLVRALMAVVLAASIAAAVVTPVPTSLPTVALASTTIYRLEIATATALLSTALVGLFVRGLVLGYLPTTIGREGVRWAEADE